MGQEMPIVNGKFRDMAFQSPDICFLANWLAGINFTRDNGGKIFDFENCMVRLKKNGENFSGLDNID